MTKQPEPLAEGWRLFRLGQLSAAIREANTAATTFPSLAPQSQLLKARCLADQGQFLQAEALLTYSLASLPTKSEDATQIRLQRAFLDLYISGNPSIILQECRTVLNQTSNPRLSALAQDLLGRALASAVLWNLAPLYNLDEAKCLLAQAVDGYALLGDRQASLASLLKLGDLFRLSCSPDPIKSRAIFEQVIERATAENDIVVQAAARRSVAELLFDFYLAQNKNKDVNPSCYQEANAMYQEAITLYESVESFLGMANSLMSFGNRLIDLRLNGVDLVNQALKIYQAESNLMGIYNVQKTLGLWCLYYNHLEEAQNYHNCAANLAQKMGFAVGESSAYLGVGNYFSSKGDYAQALSAYEQAESLSLAPVNRGFVKMSLANVYSMMNLPERSERACRDAIALFSPHSNAPNSFLSLAYFMLGEVLESQEKWNEAIATLNEGSDFDEACENYRGQADKLKELARITVVKEYKNSHQITAKTYDWACELSEKAISLLTPVSNNEAVLAIAGIYEEQAQIAIFAEKHLDALHYMESARQIYVDLEFPREIAAIDVLIGLTYHGLGNSGYYDCYLKAAPYYESSLSYYEKLQMRNITWRIRFYLADTFWMRSFQQTEAREQQSYWDNANNLLEQAAADIEILRGTFIETDSISAQISRLGLVSDKETVYTFAIKLHHRYLQDNGSAFNWLEKLKGRAFLDSLALTPIPAPDFINKALLERERKLLIALESALTQAEAVELSESLREIWKEMANDPAASEYVNLRLGEPINWKTVQLLLQL